MNLLPGGRFYLGHFSPKRFRRAVAHHFSRSQPSDLVEFESEPNMDNVLEARERSRSPQDRGASVDMDQLFDDFPGGQASDDVEIDITDYIDFSVPTSEIRPAEATQFKKGSRLIHKGFHFMKEAFSASNEETRMPESRAEAAERKASRLREEINANSLTAQEWAEREVAHMRDEHEANFRRGTKLYDKKFVVFLGKTREKS